MAIILEEIYEVALHRYNMKLVAGGIGLRNLVDWVHTCLLYTSTKQKTAKNKI